MSPPPSTAAPSKLTLGRLLEWFVYCAAYFSIVGCFSEVVQRDSPSGLRLAALGVCWLLLLVSFVRARHWGATMVHLSPALMTAAFLAIFRDIEFSSWIAVLHFWFASLFSFPMSVAKSMEHAIQRISPRWGHLTFCTIGAVVVVAAICAVPLTIFRGTLHWPAVTFGALLGLWVGLYHAVETSPWLENATFGGMPARATVLTGFAAALIGPIVLLVMSNFVSTILPLPLTPLLLGLPAAITGGLLARRSNMSR